MYGVILDKMDYEPALIIRDIEQNFQYVISFLKAWQAKQKVFEMRFGTYEASYDNLPRMLEAIVHRNPGSAYDTYSVPSLSGGPSILLRAFFCIGACVRAFTLRPLPWRSRRRISRSVDLTVGWRKTTAWNFVLGRWLVETAHLV